jgi:hypothetical protein
MPRGKGTDSDDDEELGQVVGSGPWGYQWWWWWWSLVFLGGVFFEGVMKWLVQDAAAPHSTYLRRSLCRQGELAIADQILAPFV